MSSNNFFNPFAQMPNWTCCDWNSCHETAQWQAMNTVGQVMAENIKVLTRRQTEAWQKQSQRTAEYIKENMANSPLEGMQHSQSKYAAQAVKDYCQEARDMMALYSKAASDILDVMTNRLDEMSTEHASQPQQRNNKK